MLNPPGVSHSRSHFVCKLPKNRNSNGPTLLTRKAPNTTIAEFANTVDPDEMAQNDRFFNILVYIERFWNYTNIVLPFALLAL